MGKEKCPKCGNKNEEGWKFCGNCAYKNDLSSAGRSSCSYNFVCMGSGGVGKSAITIQFINNHFQSTYDPTIEDRYQKVVDYKGVPCFLEVLDTAGQDTFVAMRELYMRNGEGFALIFSITNLRSLQELDVMRKGIIKQQGDDVPIILVANKCDLEAQRKVPQSDIESTSNEWKRPYLNVSAKENHNVKEIFENLIQQQWDRTGGPPVSSEKRRSCLLF